MKKRTTQILCLLLAVFWAFTGSCGRQQDPTESTTLSEDEIYLVDAYVQVKRAGSDYLNRQAFAESLFIRLDSTIDTVRIANTIRTINQTPERWDVVFREIEDNLRAAAKDKKLEEPGR